MNDKDTISVSNPNKTKALKIASTFSNKIARMFPEMRHRKLKVRTDRIWMICAGKYPSVLLEYGFISNKKDLAYINDIKTINKLAKGIVDCIYAELLSKEQGKKVNTKPASKRKHK
jgi:N-acetylmuramoyl-L-alanine amidase